MSTPGAPHPLIGRDAELAGLHALWRDGARLVTLTGPPGIGKSALAQAALVDAPGTWRLTVSLRGVQGTDGVVAAVARALGACVDLDAAASDVSIGERLSCAGAGTLVLDDVVEAVTALAMLVPRWQQEAAEVTWLVASRQRLFVAGERVVELGLLGLDDTAQLFTRQAQHVLHGWRCPEAHAEVFVELLRQLDGLPLAIELAARRIDLLALPQLSARVRAGDLGGRGGGVLERALEASWSLLEPSGRAVLASLALLDGGLRPADAEPLFRGEIGDEDALEVLAVLRRHSLLRRDHGQERLVMLSVVRRFAAGRLDAAELERRLRHLASFFLERLGGDSDLSTDGLQRRLDEADNLLGLHRRLRSIDVELAGAVLALVAPVLRACGTVTTLQSMFDRLTVEEVPALQSRRFVARAQETETRAALDALERSLRALGDGASGAIDDDARTARLRLDIARALGRLGRHDEALAHLETAMPAARAAGVGTLFNAVQERLALTLLQLGRTDAALAQLERGVERERRRGGRELPRLLVAQGRTLIAAERLAEAVAPLVEADAILAVHADVRLQALVDEHLAILAPAWYPLAAAHARLSGLKTLRAAWLLVIIDLLRGERDAARERCGRLVASGHGRPRFAPHVRAVLDLLDGRPHRVVENIAAETDDDEAGALLALARAMLGQREAALDMVGSLASLPSPLLDAVSGVLRGTPPALTPGALLEGGCLRHPRQLVLAWLVERLVAEPSPRVSAQPVVAAVDAPLAEGTMQVADDGSRVRLPGEPPVEIVRPLLQRLVVALAQHRIDAPHEALASSELFALGWPDENISPRSARARLYSAIHTLRELGLRDVLQTRNDGYLIDPRLAIAWHSTPADRGEPDDGQAD